MKLSIKRKKPQYLKSPAKCFHFEEIEENLDNIKVSQELEASNLSKTPTLDLDKVSAIKNALSRGDYPIGSSDGVLLYRGYSSGAKTFVVASNPNQ